MARSDDMAQMARAITDGWIEEGLSAIEILERSEQLQDQLRACVFERIKSPDQ